MKRIALIAVALVGTTFLRAAPLRAEISDGVVRIGVLSDMSGVYLEPV
jgi:hypothetical protein